MKETAIERVKSGGDLSEDVLRNLTLYHLKYSRGKEQRSATDYDWYQSFASTVSDLIVERYVATQGSYFDQDVRRVYYLSMEFLLGKFLKKNLMALGVMDEAREALDSLGLDLDRMFEMDIEPGLGNGGLGRLAACYLDSAATQEYPVYGYGLRYEYGMFKQDIMDGWQCETPDYWLGLTFPWELVRPEYTQSVLLYGRVERMRMPNGKTQDVWVDWQMIEGVPYDLPIMGFGVNNVNTLRLWKAESSSEFRLDAFNEGDYESAVSEKNWAENVTKVLYPADSHSAGKELRLIQEYFLVTCSLHDLVRRHKKAKDGYSNFAEKNAIQLNDTHPALTVSELMRILIDEEGLAWEEAWEITSTSCAYTNHTLLPEALEKWPVDMLGRVLPRHLQIIYEINARFLQQVELKWPGDVEKMRQVSIIEEGRTRQVRMANLAMVGGHKVNGVSALHSELLKTRVMNDFVDIYPDKFINITNGITPRRWLCVCNPELAELITSRIGKDWIRDLDQLRKLEKFAEDEAFQDEFYAVKLGNKQALAKYVQEKLGEVINAESLFDVQIKRLHMYKRQLLNVLHIIYLYQKILKDPSAPIVPRTFLFGAKAAPSYHIAKLVIKLINSVGAVINRDPRVAGRLKVLFLPNYNVSLAERIIPAADLSEQISTAGLEASGTGNMKLSLNGALTVGTWDGANIEIAKEVGEDNIYIFGKRVEDLECMMADGYNPWTYYDQDEELRAVLDSLKGDQFCPGESGLFIELFHELTTHGDHFMYLPDFRAYVEAQEKVSADFNNKREWLRMSILNVARMGFFSSDRSIRDYAEKIWSLDKVSINDEAVKAVAAAE